MRDFLKRWYTEILSLSGLAWLLKPRYAGAGVIFNFHRVVRSEEETADLGLAVTTEVLDDLLHTGRRLGWEFVDLDEAADRLERGPRAGRFACCTFDDGFLDNLSLALPIFRAHRAPMTVFACPGLLDRSVVPYWALLDRLIVERDELRLGLPFLDVAPARTHAEKVSVFRHLVGPVVFRTNDALRERVLALMAEEFGDLRAATDSVLMSWDELRALAADPYGRVGAHTVTHAALARLPEAEARREMAESRDRLEAELRRPVRHFAYPFGGQNECGAREFALARELGFRTAVTTRRGNVYREHREHLTGLPRTAVAVMPRAQTPHYVRASLYGARNAVLNKMRRVVVT